MSVISKEERDNIRFDKSNPWKGAGFCMDCNKLLKSKSCRCKSCAAKKSMIEYNKFKKKVL